MSIADTIQVLNGMVDDGVIERYAIAGAVAALNYLEPRFTSDVDIFVTLESKAGSGLISLAPLVSYLADRGYTQWLGEGLVVEGWPVQFLPTSDILDVEALDRAVEVEDDYETGKPVKTRVLSPEHIVAIAARTGRSKDFLRIDDFIEQQKVDLGKLRDVLIRHDLIGKWSDFCRKTGRSDPLGLME